MRTFLLSLLLTAPVVASADDISVRLEQPVAATTLRGGSTAVIAWSADSLGPDVEEWEAFLSVDGGKYYGARITPHLDISIREFRWTVPNVDTSNARILLRFGNERQETGVESPLRFSISASRGRMPLGRNITSERGEAARPGDPGVATWVDSDRHGSNLQPFESRPDSMRPVKASAHDGEDSESASDFSIRSDDRGAIRAPSARRTFVRSRPPLTRDPLLQSCRLNI